MSHSIADIRTDYKLKSLGEEDVAEDAIVQFGRWWDEAIASKVEEVNAMTLATATSEGEPDARIVLLKDYSEEGFVFFTNYNSQKGAELHQNPKAAMVFFWRELERQVRISGNIEKVAAADSDAYFHSRPLQSRIGAWASPQSTVIPNREELEKRVAGYEQQFAGNEVPRPPHWGGYILKPQKIEFWQGRSNRLHDRIIYRKTVSGNWNRERLAP